MAAYGVPETDIARVLGIDPKTLRKHYREGSQCVTAAIFWMKTRGGWRESPQAHEVAVKNATDMTDDELIARIRMLDDQIGPMIELRANSQEPPTR